MLRNSTQACVPEKQPGPKNSPMRELSIYPLPQMQARRGVIEMLVGPEPTKGACGQQRVDESIGGLFDNIAPRLAFPDAVAQDSHTVGKERRRPRHAEDAPIGGARHDAVRSEIRYDDAYDQSIDKPHRQKLGHRRRAAGEDAKHAYRSLLVFFLCSRRIHFLVRAIRKNIKALLQTGGTQGGEKLVFIG